MSLASPDDGNDEPARRWDAASYHKVSGPMEAMGAKVLDRLPLAGDETVLDAGCGTGRVTALLCDRLPQGRVLAVDADAAMVAACRATLGEQVDAGHVEVRQVDLLALDLDAEVDAVLSTATFHWILDHDLLFARLFAALRPGGRLVAQCGGDGNIASILGAADAVGAGGPWADRFDGWVRPSRMATAEETAAKLTGAGFGDVRTWLEPAPQVPDEPAEYLRTVNLGAHLHRLDEPDHDEFVRLVLQRLPRPVTIDYVRLNMDATRPAAAG
ncbi:MAG: methyltransferase domain-containing protein [Actinomycetota bacterium]|nr:methyltransferase domain-containing protein [Actinomycetota bacterium]